MSPRTFARRFRQVTGTTPGEWLLEQRPALARRMLEATDQTVERIAHQAGHGGGDGGRVEQVCDAVRCSAKGCSV
jgi:transcriptional regulator GlxA family with amidase domain